ncbi:GWT1-domain-containing protein [Blastocladiella britannica]|nr:GWT1-domain-containing protein [Blastocladiella britannica]
MWHKTRAQLGYWALKLLCVTFPTTWAHSKRPTAAWRLAADALFLVYFPCAVVLFPNPLATAPFYTAGVAILSTWTLAVRDRINASIPTATWISQLNNARSHRAVTVFRGWMMSLTSFAILAVDFTVFPRQSAKTEMFGLSLMDFGVGATVLSSGIVSGMRSCRSALQPQQQGALATLAGELQRALPMLALGVIRLLMVRSADYTVDPSEYGVHWNFFFTLGALGPMISVVRLCIHRGNDLVRGLAVTGVYEAVIHATQLTEYVQHAPRTHFFSSNREGMLSLFGYVALYYYGRSLGAIVGVPRPTLSAWRRAGIQVLAVALVAATAVAVVPAPIGGVAGVSRRLANAGFQASTVALCAMQLGLLMVLETLVPGESGEMAELLNRGSLFMFLLGNLGTGAVNVAINTMLVDRETAVGILAVYMSLILAANVVYTRWKQSPLSGKNN